jgi:Peptidase family M41
VPRGHALGMVTQVPDKDEFSVTKQQMSAGIDVCMGGKVAEEIIFGADQVVAAPRQVKQAWPGDPVSRGSLCRRGPAAGCDARGAPRCGSCAVGRAGTASVCACALQRVFSFLWFGLEGRGGACVRFAAADGPAFVLPSQVTTGARSDLQQATKWARHMVGLQPGSPPPHTHTWSVASLLRGWDTTQHSSTRCVVCPGEFRSQQLAAAMQARPRCLFFPFLGTSRRVFHAAPSLLALEAPDGQLCCRAAARLLSAA